jgi:hypothetical protein
MSITKILHGFQINSTEAKLLVKQFPNVVYPETVMHSDSQNSEESEESDVSGYSLEEEEPISEIMSELVEKIQVKFKSLNLKRKFEVFVTDFDFDGSVKTKTGDKKFDGDTTIVVGVVLGSLRTEYEGVMKCPKSDVSSIEILRFVKSMDEFRNFSPNVGIQIYSSRTEYNQI